MQDGNSGKMTQGADATSYKLLVNNYSAASGIYFRARAVAPGVLDGLSNIVGPYVIVADTPPVVAITSPAASGIGQDSDHPLVINVDATGAATFTITAETASNRLITSLNILFDGSTIAGFKDGVTTGSIDYKTTVIGDHVIEAVAIDDLGMTARAGTGPLFVRIAPAGGVASAKAALVGLPVQRPRRPVVRFSPWSRIRVTGPILQAGRTLAEIPGFLVRLTWPSSAHYTSGSPKRLLRRWK